MEDRVMIYTVFTLILVSGAVYAKNNDSKKNIDSSIYEEKFIELEEYSEKISKRYIENLNIAKNRFVFDDINIFLNNKQKKILIMFLCDGMSKDEICLSINMDEIYFDKNISYFIDNGIIDSRLNITSNGIDIIEELKKDIR